MEIVSNEKKTTFDFRKCNIQFAKISYDISTGKTVSDLTGGVLTGDKYNKPLTEKLVLERLNSSVASLRYKIGGNYAPFPKNFQVNHLFNGQSVILEKTHIQSVELYLLCISDNYTVVYNDKTVFLLRYLRRKPTSLCRKPTSYDYFIRIFNQEFLIFFNFFKRT